MGKLTINGHFNSYVSLPEGSFPCESNGTTMDNPLRSPGEHPFDHIYAINHPIFGGTGHTIVAVKNLNLGHNEYEEICRTPNISEWSFIIN